MTAVNITSTNSPHIAIELIIRKSGDALWEQISETLISLGGKLSAWGRDTLAGAIGHAAQTVIVEDNYVCKDYRSLYSGFLAAKFTSRPSRCHRLHFFATPIENLFEFIKIRQEELNKFYLGYSVIQPMVGDEERSCIGRTVFDPRACTGEFESEKYTLRTRFSTQLLGRQMSVKGYPFIAQNTESLVCAHAALWGVCRYLSERYSDYREVYPYDIVSAVGDHEGRRVPHRGMTYRDYSEILTGVGSHPLILDRPSFETVYSYVESGFPVLLSAGRHVNVAIGHTLNSSECDKSSFSIDGRNAVESHVYADSLIVMDDNMPPYTRMERNEVTTASTQQEPLRFDGSITSMVVPLPDKVFLTPDYARQWSRKAIGREPYLNAWAHEELPNNYWIGPIVARTFLTSSNRFKSKKRRFYRNSLGNRPQGDGDSLALQAMRLSLPHFVWITEFASAKGFRDGKVFAEFVYDATASRNEGALIYARVGKSLFLPGARWGRYPMAPFEFDQFRHNLGDYSNA